MTIIDAPRIVFVDVDDTLLTWKEELAVDSIPVKGPTGKIMLLRPLKKNIQQLKLFHLRGFAIVVWSKSGAEWARRAVEILQLEDHVDVVMPKPDYFIDDKNAEHFMTESIRNYYPIEDK